MIEAGGNQAMFLDPNGVTLMKGIGESVTDQRVSAEIVEILADHVVLRHDDRLFTLQLNQ